MMVERAEQLQTILFNYCCWQITEVYGAIKIDRFMVGIPCRSWPTACLIDLQLWRWQSPHVVD